MLVGPAPTTDGSAENTLNEKRLVHGSIAFWLGPRAPQTKTHRWTVYVRGAHDPLEDLSLYIQKVEFVLHESFADPVRVVKEPPFCLTEHGWGEFEVIIRLFPISDPDKPVEMYHPLRLFPSVGQELTEKPVVSEHLDVLVFSQPAPEVERALHRSDVARMPSDCWGDLMPLFGGDLHQVEEEDLRKVQQARERVRQQIQATRLQYEALTAELARARTHALHRELS